ncbi:sulfatase [Streptomyces abyssomicinicus]|uniref:sulfatase n=1 Tax=Streptomyces abyssomicinicus TaxID=574929 RepID=UPI0012500A30|nr:sulfatase [Streptomyces abyssomicinicus]
MKNRHARRLGLLTLPVALTLTAVGPPSAAQETGAGAGRPGAQRPNIVFVLGDDFGWTDLSSPLTNQGNPNDYYETPALERIAAEGTAFDNAYASPNCAPTRAALLTGLYAPRPTNNIYLVDNLNRGGDDTLLVGPPQGLPDEDVALPAEAVTVGERLQGAGYTTGYLGKFHVAATPSDITAQHGFDENIGGTHAGAPGAYHAQNGTFVQQIGPELDAFAADYTQQYVDENIKPFSHGTDPAAVDALVGTDKHVSDALADATIDFVDRNKDEPFFAFLSSYAVHTPVGDKQARADLLAKYRAKSPGAGPSNAAYGALVEGLDQTVARVVEHLETTADPRRPGHVLADNTVVVFTGDNGGVGKFTDNGPLRGEKGTLREGGLRVPLIAWSGNPRLVDGGTVDHTPVYSADLHTTFASLAGARKDDVRPLDGADLSGLFADATTELDRDALYWHLPGYLIDDARDQHPQSVIRSGRWKLIYDYEGRSWELYDLAADIGESHDRADDEPQVVHRLGHKLIRWLDKVDAPLATLREGQAPLSFRVSGETYADGRVSRHRGETLVVEPGEEVPVVLAGPTGH